MYEVYGDLETEWEELKSKYSAKSYLAPENEIEKLIKKYSSYGKEKK